MFKQSEIGAKCACEALETVMAHQGVKRFLLPAGYYGDYFEKGGYYSAFWWTLRCDQCGNVRDDFIVYSWRGSNGYYPVVPAFPKQQDHERYDDIKRAILNMMPD